MGTSRVQSLRVICYSPAGVGVMADGEAEVHIHRGRLRIAIVGVRKENVPP